MAPMASRYIGPPCDVPLLKPTYIPILCSDLTPIMIKTIHKRSRTAGTPNYVS